MLVFCFRGHTFVVYLRTTEVTTIVFSRNSLYSFYSRNPTCEIPPCLRISNRKYPPFLRNSSSKTPLPFGNPKSRLCYRYGYFLESPNAWSLFKCANDITSDHLKSMIFPRFMSHCSKLVTAYIL